MLKKKGEDLNLMLDYLIEDSIKKGGKTLNLSKLRLSSEDLKKILSTIAERLGGLEVLYLNDNKIIELPDSIGNLKNLKQLNLNGNKIKTLPDSLKKHPKLEWLYLNDNEFIVFPYDSQNQPPSSLRKVSLENNPIYLSSILLLIESKGENLKNLYKGEIQRLKDLNLVAKVENFVGNKESVLQREILAAKVVKSYRDISAEVFYDFLKHLNDKIIVKINLSSKIYLPSKTNPLTYSYRINENGQLRFFFQKPSKETSESTDEKLSEFKNVQISDDKKNRPELRMQRSLSDKDLLDRLDLVESDTKKVRTNTRRRIFP